MTITEFVQKAIEGGWVPEEGTLAIWHINNPYKILLSPSAWQAAGKVKEMYVSEAVRDEGFYEKTSHNDAIRRVLALLEEPN